MSLFEKRQFQTPDGSTFQVGRDGIITVVSAQGLDGGQQIGPEAGPVYNQLLSLGTGGAQFVKPAGDPFSYVAFPDGRILTMKGQRDTLPSSLATAYEAPKGPRAAILSSVFGNKLPEPVEVTQIQAAPETPETSGGSETTAPEEEIELGHNVRGIEVESAQEPRISPEDLRAGQNLKKSRRVAAVRGAGALLSGRSLGQALEPRETVDPNEAARKARMISDLAGLEKAQYDLLKATGANRSQLEEKLYLKILDVVQTDISTSRTLAGTKASSFGNITRDRVQSSIKAYEALNPITQLKGKTKDEFNGVSNTFAGLVSLPTDATVPSVANQAVQLISDAPPELRPAIVDHFSAQIARNGDFAEQNITDFNSFIKGASGLPEDSLRVLGALLDEGKTARSQIEFEADKRREEVLEGISELKNQYGTNTGTAGEEGLKLLESIFTDRKNLLPGLKPDGGKIEIGGPAIEAIKKELEESGPTTRALTPSRARARVEQTAGYQAYKQKRMDEGQINERAIFRDYVRSLPKAARRQDQSVAMAGREAQAAERDIQRENQQAIRQEERAARQQERLKKPEEGQGASPLWEAGMSTLKRIIAGVPQEPGSDIVEEKTKKKNKPYQTLDFTSSQ